MQQLIRLLRSRPRPRAALAVAAVATALMAAAPSVQAQRSQFSTWAPWLWITRANELPPATGVQDPHYGDSLFHFYQSRYFSAVTNLMVSQHFARMPRHADEAEILRGGLFLSYGLHREAGEVFAQLIERGAPPPVRDRAWYFLAKIRYQRGLLAEADDALSRIDKPLPVAALEEDRQLLTANVLLARGRYAQAATVLKAIPPTSEAAHYARYNLGVALIRDGKALDGGPVLAALGGLVTDNEDLRALRDRANVAMGFASLQQGNTILARDYLQRVRLTGPMSNKALLGFGWAAAEQKRFTNALAPWTELAQRDLSDAAVLEAKLAVPYAYAELGAHQQALALYQQAIGAFDRETAAIDASVAAIRDGKLLDGLMARNPGEEMGWFWNITDLPEMPHLAPLAPILAEHAFQEGFKNYRDLVFLGNNLRQWDEKLGVLRDMLANRRLAFEQKLPEVQARERQLNLAQLESRSDALRAELQRVEQAADVAALADARERDLMARLDAIDALLARGLPDVDAVAVRERARRARGALQWQQTQQFPQRLWQASKAMRETEDTLRQAQQRDGALLRAQREEPARLDAFGQRIDVLAQRVAGMIPRVAQLAREQQVALQEEVVAELLKQKERLAGYNTQARFAVAQIYDRAAGARAEPSPQAVPAATEGATAGEGTRAPAR